MAEKTKIEVSLILPQGSDCQACLGRLQQAVQRYHGVEVTHLDDEADRPRLCIHYDPSSANPDYLRAIAAEEGAILAWRYRHETLAVEYDGERVARPAIVSRVRALGYDVATPAASAELVFQVEGLDCADCALHLEEALRRTPGVAEVSLDFSLARLRVMPEAGAQIAPAVERVAKEMGQTLQPERAGAGEEAQAGEQVGQPWPVWLPVIRFRWC